MYSREIKGNTAKACGYNLRVSTKNSKPVCKALQGMEVAKAKKLLEDMIDEKRSLKGKYYTSISTEILQLIKSAEKNAEFKNLDTKNLFIAHIASAKGSTMRRRRHKNKIGNQIKATHLEIILKERSLPGAEKKVIEKPGAKKEPEKKVEEKKEVAKAEKAAAHKEKVESKKEEVKEAIKEKVKAEIKKAKPKEQEPKKEAKAEKKAKEAPKAAKKEAKS